MNMHTLSSSWRRKLTCAAVLFLLCAPVISAKGFLLGFLSQAAIISIFALSYNMLLGQAGMLSFGHALYSGIGAYCAIHFINRFGADALGLGMLAVPLVGALGGGLAGLVFGFVCTRRSGTAYAMITLGLAEMVVALAAMLPGLSGGETGISTNRMLSSPVFGLTLGPAVEMYYVILLWAGLAGLVMYAYTRTPVGRLANAVRDNAERVAFVGFNPQFIRLAVMTLAGMFAGIAGAASALNYELVTAENLGIGQSGMVLIATYLGGVGYFIGPVVGALVYVLFLTVVSTLTHAWLFYFGAVFIAVVLLVPEGLVALVINPAVRRRFSLKTAIGGILFAIVGITVVEAVYGLQEDVVQEAALLPGWMRSPQAALIVSAVVVAAVIAVALRRKSRVRFSTVMEANHE